MNNQQKRLLEGIQDLLSCKELIDVILVAEDSEIHCHRNVLAASSPYFRAMFHDYREKEEKTIHLHDITFQALDLAVKFMYSGHVDITHENVQCLLTASSLLQLDTLLSYCADHMAKALCVENCVDVYNLADYQSLDKLKEAAKLFILDNFGILVEGCDMLKLDRFVVKDLISSDNLNTDKEEIVFNFLLKWIQHDLENRKRLFKDYFQQIRVLLMDEEFISEHLESNGFILENPFCRAILSMSKLCRIGMNNQETEKEKQNIADEFELNTRPRLGMFRKQMLIFSGGGNSDDQRAFSCFDPSTGKNYCAVKSHPSFDFKFKIDYYQLVTNSNNQIYFLGGIFYENHHFDEDGLALDAVYKYNPKEREWKVCQPMNTPRCAFAACAIHEKVYVFGGALSYPNGVPLESVEMYDPVYNSWHQREPLPAGLTHHSATVYKDSVLVIGGEDDSCEFLTAVLQYSLHRDTWSILETRIPQPRLECTAITHNDKIYVLGGGTKIQNTTAVETFDPETLTWKYGGDFPDDRKFMATALVDGSIYVCGGIRLMASRQKGQVRSRTVEYKDLYKYDLDTETWSKEARIIQYASNQACTTAIVNTKELELVDNCNIFK